MKRQAILIILFILSQGSCNLKRETTEVTEVTENKVLEENNLTTNFEHFQTDKYSISESNEEEFSQAIKNAKYPLIKDNDIKKINGEIRLSNIVFKDLIINEDETSEIIYNYIGHFKETNASVIHAQFYEGSEIYLINHENNYVDTLWDIPKLSQNLNYYFNLSHEYGMEGVPNGFQIWRINKDGTLLKHSELDQINWVPKDFAWLDSQTIILKVISVEKFMNDQNSTEIFYIKVRIK